MPYVEIQDEELLYDRTRNFSGINDYTGISDISCPTNGSYAEFLAKDKTLISNNNYLNILPVGINNVYANYNMVYEVDEPAAQELANFLESKRGIENVAFETDPTIYRKLSGYCTNYSINQIDVKTFSLTASFEVTESPGHLNWTGMNFLYPSQETTFYEPGNKIYKKHDVAYDSRLEATYQDKLNNFFYCVEEHNSSIDTSPTLEESPYWTREFFWQPDVGQSSQVEIDVKRFGDTDGFPLRRKIKTNTATFPLNYSFSNISTHQLKGMLHFLESRNGYKRFKHRIGAVYNRPKVYVCRRWRHSWVSYDSHNLEVTFDEDPLGLVPDRIPQTAETLSTRVYLSDGELFDSTSGNVPSFWQDGVEEIFDLKIGGNCKEIGESAFEDCINLGGQLRIPGSVTGIQNNAFAGCIGYDDNLILGGGVREINDAAFSGCSNITGDLIIPPSTTDIGQSVFEGCNALNGRLNIGKNLETIGSRAFYGLSKLTGPLDIPPTLTIIENQAFRGCQRLFGDLIIPSGVQEIRDGAFRGCNRLGRDVRIGNSINYLGNNIFFGCRFVYNVYINADTAPTVAGGAGPFASMSRLQKIHVPVDGSGYNTAFWQGLGDKLVFDL